MDGRWSPKRLLSHLKAVLEAPTAGEHAENTFSQSFRRFHGKHKKQGRLAVNERKPGKLQSPRRKGKKT
jgi:hypothetical protein